MNILLRFAIRLPRIYLYGWRIELYSKYQLQIQVIEVETRQPCYLFQGAEL